MSAEPTSQSPPTATASYRSEASGDLVAMSFPGARRVAGWLFWVVFPVLSLLALVSSVTGIIGHVGNQPDGIRGAFTASRQCSSGICLLSGQFVSDDGLVRRSGLLGDQRWKSGTEHRVVWDGKNWEVTALPGHWDVTTAVMAGVGAITYLGVVGYFARVARRETEEHQ